MNKSDLIAVVSEETETPPKTTEKIINTMLSVISDELSEGNRVQLLGFGVFETKHRKARIGRNPRTRETVQIEATDVPVFKAGKALKEKVGG